MTTIDRVLPREERKGMSVKKREISPLTRQFVQSCTHLKPERSISLGALYEFYTLYCVEGAKKPAQSKRLFIKELREMLSREIESGQIFIDNRSAVVLKGLSVRDNKMLSSETESGQILVDNESALIPSVLSTRKTEENGERVNELVLAN